MRVSSPEAGANTGSTKAAGCVAPAARPATAAVAGGPDTTALSRLGRLMNRLQSLEQAEPARFREAMGAAAARLGAAADEDQGGTAELLRALSRKFEQAGAGGAAPLSATPVARDATAAYRGVASPAEVAPQLEEILEDALRETGS
jgi:hypothetical protein